MADYAEFTLGLTTTLVDTSDIRDSKWKQMEELIMRLAFVLIIGAAVLFFPDNSVQAQSSVACIQKCSNLYPQRGREHASSRAACRAQCEAQPQKSQQRKKPK